MRAHLKMFLPCFRRCARHHALAGAARSNIPCAGAHGVVPVASSCAETPAAPPADLGVESTPMTPAEFGKLFAAETEKWGKVIRAANIKVA
jgi:hypothetical protein